MAMRYFPLLIFCYFLTTPTRAAQGAELCPVTLSQNTMMRNSTLRVTVANAPTVTEGTILLRGGRSYGPKPVAVTNGTIDYTLPDDLPLGQYAVNVTLGGRGFYACELLRVVPAPKWEVRLLPFDPEGSYEAETVTVPDKKAPKLKTARLSLRGSGFLTDRPQDNEIIINGQIQEVHWDGCNLPEPDPGHAAPNVIHGQVWSPERIELCRVPVPRDGTLRVAVKQGDVPNSGDGVFGPFTEALVKKFQESKGLPADGVVGPATRTALGI